MNKNPKIMIIEDDKFVTKAMKMKFDDSGFTSKTFILAEEGLKALEKWIPDVIILDLLLPGIDGYVFLKTVKNNPKWKNIPVIISSNLEEDKSKTSGANDYIVKSELDLDELVQRILKYSNGS